jgi:hypothetical protein
MSILLIDYYVITTLFKIDAKIRFMRFSAVSMSAYCTKDLKFSGKLTKQVVGLIHETHPFGACAIFCVDKILFIQPHGQTVADFQPFVL